MDKLNCTWILLISWEKRVAGLMVDKTMICCFAVFLMGDKTLMLLCLADYGGKIFNMTSALQNAQEPISVSLMTKISL